MHFYDMHTVIRQYRRHFVMAYYMYLLHIYEYVNYMYEIVSNLYQPEARNIDTLFKEK